MQVDRKLYFNLSQRCQNIAANPMDCSAVFNLIDNYDYKISRYVEDSRYIYVYFEGDRHRMMTIRK